MLDFLRPKKKTSSDSYKTIKEREKERERLAWASIYDELEEENNTEEDDN